MKFSIGDAANGALAFLKREGALVAPVALVFLALPTLAIQLLVPNAGMAAMEMGKADPRILWMLPVALFGVAGGVAITALVLKPGISVGEALALAARRMPVVIGAWAVLVLGLSLVALGLLILISFVGLMAGASSQSLTGLGVGVTMGLFLVAMSRLLLLIPVVVDGAAGPVAAIRRTWALTAGRFWSLLGVILLLTLGAGLISMAAGQAIGATALLLDRLTGATPVFGAIGATILATIGAAISAFLYVLVSGIYRQLAGR